MEIFIIEDNLRLENHFYSNPNCEVFNRVELQERSIDKLAGDWLMPALFSSVKYVCRKQTRYAMLYSVSVCLALTLQRGILHTFSADLQQTDTIALPRLYVGSVSSRAMGNSSRESLGIKAGARLNTAKRWKTLQTSALQNWLRRRMARVGNRSVVGAFGHWSTCRMCGLCDARGTT